jgi:two-component system CheB/CheR fusion protein
VRIDGEPLLLPADLATPFGLVLHELATNAAKYGALSRTEGRVLLSWQVRAGDGNQSTLSVVWQEENGPKAEPLPTKGFGSLLIDRAVPGATVTREFRADGLRCTIEVPLSEEEPLRGG